MKALVSIIMMVILFITVGCKDNTQAPRPVHTPSSVELVTPTYGPPTTVNAPRATLKLERPMVTTTSAPKPVEVTASLEVTASIAQAAYNVQPLPVAPVEPLSLCYEDMPCWDCSTMGNRICGVAPSATVVVQTLPLVQPLPVAQTPVQVQPIQAASPVISAPVVNPYSGNSETAESCALVGKVLAEDNSCVTPDFWDGKHAKAQGHGKGLTKNSFNRTVDTGGNSVG